MLLDNSVSLFLVRDLTQKQHVFIVLTETAKVKGFVAWFLSTFKELAS